MIIIMASLRISNPIRLASQYAKALGADSWPWAQEGEAAAAASGRHFFSTFLLVSNEAYPLQRTFALSSRDLATTCPRWIFMRDTLPLHPDMANGDSPGAQELVLQNLSRKYAREIADSGAATIQTQFSYAACLSDSTFSDDLHTAVRLLTDLLRQEYDTRSVLFFLGQAHLHLGQYKKAQQYARTLLAMEVNNRQALGLLDEIDSKLSQDAMRGAAIIGGLAAAVAVAGMLLAKARR